MRYIITARNQNGKRVVACYDEVFDSLMLLDSEENKKDYVIFNGIDNAKSAIVGYQCFQRGLTNWKAEKI